jgi:large subunit ribosomal protein L13
MADKQQTKQYEFDAANEVLGRLAAKIAVILQGKTDAAYEPRLAGNNVVIVKNASKVKVSGKKEVQKEYYHHTGYQGHLRTKPLGEMRKTNPCRMIEYAVYNMLPKNRLRPTRMKRLKITA